MSASPITLLLLASASAFASSPSMRPAPQGSYLQTCEQVRVEAATLYASCETRDGRWLRTELPRFTSCAGGIWNEDGQLTCERWQPVPQGSFLRTCADVFVDRGALFATCETMSGEWTDTRLYRWDLCSGDIANMDGQLSCPRSPERPRRRSQGVHLNTCDDVGAHRSQRTATCQHRDGHRMSAAPPRHRRG